MSRKTKVGQKHLDNLLIYGTARRTYCYPNHPPQAPFTTFCQIRYRYMTSCCEFGLKPAICESKTKVGQKHLDNLLIYGTARRTFCYPNHPRQAPFTTCGHISVPDLAKCCERRLLRMVWIAKSSSGRAIDEQIIEVFLADLCFRLTYGRF